MNPLQRAIDILGSQTELALRLDEMHHNRKIQQPHIYGWLTKYDGIPPVEYCASIEILTKGKVTRKDFYPDSWMIFWPELADNKV